MFQLTQQSTQSKVSNSGQGLTWRIFLRRSMAWVLLFVWVMLWWIVPNLDWCGVQFEVKRTSFFFLGMMCAVYLPRHLICQGGDSHVTFKPLRGFWNYSFWIYCTHIIFLGYILSISHFAFGKSDVAVALLTPMATIVTILLGVASASIVRGKWPTVFSALNGGR